MSSQHEIFQMLAPRFSSTAALRRWYRSQKIPGYNLTAADLVKAGRASDVVDYLKAVDSGVHA